MRQLVYMLSEITGEPQEVSRRMIMETETGQAVARKNMAVLYEQQTENLYGIVMELRSMDRYRSIADGVTSEKIAGAMKKLDEARLWEKSDSAMLKIARRPERKPAEKKELMERQKRALRIKRQNRVNEGKIEHADKFKGQ
ncbi:MAG: hypothetical protein NC337_08400 [Roseburia sp.]|nr:hypothetical protein [Roseburia sp.]